ncbi:cyclohexadienyl dehydratase [Izhakiella capsodis]|uniref:Cyclohexadienyl dehydratase n=1 Tax=Izhakiella capsodis TaxID=1367852 RepID=A0A1I4VXE2_9GAMM|nr:cyclohexadienyl dehydratase [Izhakiella capsodis]
MGGISVTLQCQQAWFAERLDTDENISRVRCADRTNYQTIEQRNQPVVRLIEPAGGTNEAFVHSPLPRASLSLFYDNLKIFQQMVDNRAHVMFTDASGAQFQMKHYPQHCGLNPQKPLQ